MSRGNAPVTQAQINRAIKAAKAQGMTVDILPNGTIRVVPLPVAAFDARETSDFANRPVRVF